MKYIYEPQYSVAFEDCVKYIAEEKDIVLNNIVVDKDNIKQLADILQVSEDFLLRLKNN